MSGVEDPGDRDLFTDPSVFGDVADYDQPLGPVAVAGVFTNAHLRVLDGAGPGASTTAPVFAIFDEALPVPPSQGDTLSLRGRDWRVADMEPDGTGMVRLILEEI